MKYIIIALFILFRTLAWAECSDSVTTNSQESKQDINTKVPAGMEGATIIVRQANGKESSCPIEKCKVVPRKQQFIVTKIENDTMRLCGKDEKNRVSILGGKGPKNSLDTNRSGTTATVENGYGTTLGLQYQRDTGKTILGLPVNVGVQAQDNKSGLVLIGVDF